MTTTASGRSHKRKDPDQPHSDKEARSRSKDKRKEVVTETPPQEAAVNLVSSESTSPVKTKKQKGEGSQLELGVIRREIQIIETVDPESLFADDEDESPEVPLVRSSIRGAASATSSGLVTEPVWTPPILSQGPEPRPVLQSASEQPFGTVRNHSVWSESCRIAQPGPGQSSQSNQPGRSPIHPASNPNTPGTISLSDRILPDNLRWLEGPLKSMMNVGLSHGSLFRIEEAYPNTLPTLGSIKLFEVMTFPFECSYWLSVLVILIACFSRCSMLSPTMPGFTTKYSGVD